MSLYTVQARFTWGEQTFSFPFEHEANAFRDAVLLCRECILTKPITKFTTVDGKEQHHEQRRLIPKPRWQAATNTSATVHWVQP